MASGTSIGRMFVELGLKDADFQKGMKEAEKSVLQLQKVGRSFGKALDSAVSTGFKAAAASAVAFGASAVMVGQQFEQSLVTVGAIAGASTGEMQQLEDAARNLGATTEFTASQAAVAMQDFARAGMTVNEIVDASGPAMLLAGSAGADMAQATGLMAATLAQFTLGAGESTRVSDVFSTALRKSLFDMSSLTEAMKYAGTIGASFGYTLEETTASVAMFRNLGLEGSLAGTNLRMALAAAAKPAASAAAALKKYNLEIKDINPELNSFADIMQTVGDAGITTTDALAIFGTRAGANVATIARQFADGSTDFHNLLNDLENSAGSTADLYDAMGQTVQYQARVALSALQELLLSTFDTFRGPLQALMAELASTIQYVAGIFAKQSAGIGGTFEATIGAAIDYLRDNREVLAATFVGLVTGVAEATQALASMLPVLRSLGLLMLSVWVADKVRVFTIAVQAAVTGISTMGTSVRALAASLTVATGGLYALVAAIGAAVAVMLTYAVAMDGAESAAQRLRDAEALLAGDRAAREAQAAAQSDALVDGMAARLGVVQEQIQADGQLTNVLDRQLTALQNLTTEQVQAGLASGELFEATLNGERVVLDHAAALQLQYEQTAVAADVTDGLTAAQNRNTESQVRVAKEWAGLNAAINEYDRLVALGTDESLAFAGGLNEYGSSIEVVRAQVQAYDDQLSELGAQEQGLAEQRELALQRLTKSERTAAQAADDTGTADEGSAEAARERERAEKDLQRALEQRQQLVAGILTELEDLYLDDEGKLRASYERRLDALQATFAEETAKREELGEDTRQVVVAQAEAEVALWKVYQKEISAAREKEALRAAAEVAKQVESLEAEAAASRANRLQTIELERLAALKDAEGASAEDIARINAVFNDRAAAARSDLMQQVVDLTSDESQAVIALRRERDALLSALDDDMVDEQQQVWDHYDEAIAQATDNAADDTEDSGSRIGAALKAIGKAAIAAGEAVWSALQVIGPAIAGALLELTGFSFSLSDAVGSVEADLQAAQDLADQLASGDLSAAEYEEAMASLPASAAEGAAAFVTELIEGAVSLVQTFVEAAPVLISELAAQIPVLVQTVVESVPSIVDALMAELPGLVKTLADGLVSLTNVVVQQLPQIVQALVAQVPVILDALSMAIPMLLDGIAEAISALLAAVPDIITALMEQLPTVILGLLGAVDTIVVALVDAIPGILQALIDQLPTIVQALVNGLLSLVGTLITSILGELVPALVGMIPAIVQALMSAVTLLVQEVVLALPMLIEALLVAVVDIVVAVIAMVPQVLVAIVEMLPALIQAVVALIPAIIEGVIAAIPTIITELIGAIPTLVVALVTELIPALVMAIPEIIASFWSFVPELVSLLWEEVFKGIADFVRRIWEKLTGWIGDLFGNDTSDAGESWWDDRWDGTFWNDTPGMQRIGGGTPGMVGFAPGDYYVAAQSPGELLRQAVAGMGLGGAQLSLPGIEGLSAAILQAADSIGRVAAPGGGSGGGDLRVTIQADGQTLDDVLFRAGKRGKAPNLERRANKATVQAGVHPGFNRGKYQK